MADEFQSCSGNWWNSDQRIITNTEGEGGGSGGRRWQHQQQEHQTKAAAISVESGAASVSSLVFQDTNTNTQKPQEESDSTGDGCGGGNSILLDSTLQIMGYGLSSSSPSIHWNNPSLLNNNQSSTSGRFDHNNNFGCMLQEHITSPRRKMNPHQEQGSDLDSGFSLEQHSSTLYECPSSLLQGLFEPDYQTTTNNFFMNTNDSLSSPTWPIVAPKQVQQPSNINNQLHFSNNARFWNAMDTSTSSLFPSQQIQSLTTTSFEDKPNCSNQNPLKNKADSSSVVKKSSSNEPSFKRPRAETPSTLPTFKVRKEKLGDRITALQQLVSPFGKTDTASVLFEAIEYIKFLHDQVTVLSAPYLKSGAHIQHHQQNSNKTNEAQGSTSHEKDLRSRGLCLVPISSTFPVTNETATDFWTPTFGGTYR